MIGMKGDRGRYLRRKLVNALMMVLSGASALFGLFWLFWILGILVRRGAPALNWAFFTQLPTPPGMAGGGLANAIVGTLLIAAVATVIGVPVGLLAGTYLA